MLLEAEGTRECPNSGQQHPLSFYFLLQRSVSLLQMTFSQALRMQYRGPLCNYVITPELLLQRTSGMRAGFSLSLAPSVFLPSPPDTFLPRRCGRRGTRNHVTGETGRKKPRRPGPQRGPCRYRCACPRMHARTRTRTHAHTHTPYSPARPPPDTEAAPTCRQCRCRGRGVLAELVFPFPSDKDPGAEPLGHVVGLARLLWSTPHPAAPQAAAARPGCASPRLHAPRVLGDGRSRLCSALPGGRAASPRAARWPSGVFFR